MAQTARAGWSVVLSQLVFLAARYGEQQLAPRTCPAVICPEPAGAGFNEAVVATCARQDARFEAIGAGVTERLERQGREESSRDTRVLLAVVGNAVLTLAFHLGRCACRRARDGHDQAARPEGRRALGGGVLE